MKKRRHSSSLKRKGTDLSPKARDGAKTAAKLKAASGTEKLRNTTAKLEAAKEKLRSSNEKLVAFNKQSEKRNAMLGQLSDDLSNVLSGLDIPILILDSARCIRHFTPPAQKLLGLLPGDIGRPFGDLRIAVTIPDLQELIAAVIDRAVEMWRDVQSEEGRWYSLRIRPFRIGQRKIEGVLMAFVDIHELRQSRDSLLKERTFISAILDAARDLLVLVMDREGRIVQFNRACQQLTGYSFEEVKGRRPWDFLLLADETPAVKETFNKILGGQPGQFQNHWVAKDGRRLLIDWSNTAAVSAGAVEFVIATGIDRTETAEAHRKAQASESTIRALLETAAQAILAVNPQGQIVFVNGTAEKMFGHGHEELIGQPIEKLLPEKFRGRRSEHMGRWFSQPRNRQMGAGMELVGLRKDGTEFPVDVGLSYIQTPGEVLGVCFVTDVTERKRNEKALLDYQRRLQDLTANLMSVQEADNKELARELHDVFSQELAALGMEVSTLRTSHEAAGPLREQLAELGRKIRRLADQMHGASRRLHPQILHELGLEAALREECRKFSEQTGIPIRFACEQLPASLPEDVALCLYRVAQESLLNICKHAAATEARVELRGEAGGVRLRVVDTGDGFDVNDARKRGGLGLTSMEERVRMANGKFTIHSRSGNGATVEAFVPLDGNAA